MTEQRYLNFLSAEHCALLMIDHQTGTEMDRLLHFMLDGDGARQRLE